MEKIGEKIYRLRKQKGLSQEELGFELGVSRQTISKWESDAMMPTMDKMVALCNLFDVDFDYFISKESKVSSVEAVTEKNCDAAVEPVKSVKSQEGVVVGLWINSFILVISIFCTVCIGFATSSHGKAPVVVNSSGLDIWHFYLSIVFSAFFASLEAFLIVKLIKKPRT